MITGASAGFGQALAQLMVKEGGLLSQAVNGSKIVLLSRNVSGMKQTRTAMEEKGYDMSRFDVEVVSVDLSDTGNTEGKTLEYLKKQSKEYDNLILFNNAGVLGDVTSTAVDKTHPIQDYQNLFNVNMVSPVFLIKNVCQHFSTSKRTIVQTSSIAAKQALNCMSTYCSAKAGMDMFMKCLTKDHPDITTLCYSPGPMDTAMGNDLRLNHKVESVRESWEEMKEKGTIVNPYDSATKLLEVLQTGFKSGDFVDVFGRTG